MDAAQKLLKNSAILTFNAFFLATVAFAAAPNLIVPTSVSLTGTGGQSVFPASSDSTVPITYTIGAPVYADDNGGFMPNWLNVSGSTTTPASLTFSLVTTAGLNQGVHQATVTLTPTSPTGVTAVAITVTYTSGSSGGGGSGTLTASPSATVNLTAGTNSSTSATVNITTSSTGTITIGAVAAVSSGSTNWLSYQLGNTSISSTGGTSIIITANSFNLASSTYQGTVTLTPSTGTPLTITVNFTVGGASGNGSWTVTPSSVNWNFVTNSGIFQSQAVSVSTTSGSGSYTVSTTSSNNWLLATANGTESTIIGNIAIGTGFGLKIGSQGNALSAGQYVGHALIFDPNNQQQVDITVTLTVNGGNSAGLTFNPTSVSFTSALNGAQQNQVVSVTSSQGGTLSVTGSLPTGLSYGLPGNTAVGAGGTTSFTIFANPFGLAANTYSGTLQIQVGTQSSTFNVSMVVGGGATGTGTTAVAPTSLNFAYQAGSNTALVAQQKLVITGPAGPWSSSIATTDGGNWLKLSPGNGNALPDTAVSGATPIVSIDPTNLSVGTHAGTITITTGGGTQAVQVSINVLSGPVILPTPGALIFTAQTGQANPGGQSIYFSGSDSTLNPLAITAVSNNDWITITTGATFVSVLVDQKNFGTGVYSGSISVSQVGAGNSPTTIPILLVVNGGGGSGGSGTLTFTPSSILLSSVNGSIPGATTLSIGANASTSFVGTISYTGNSTNWLTVSPLSGVTPTNLSISANPAGLAIGTYNATISFNSSGVIQNVGVQLTVSNVGGGNTGNINITPTSLTFTGQPGDSPGAQSIAVSSASGASGVTFTVQVTAGSNWLTTSANTINTAPAQLTVSVNSTTLAAGTYSGNIQLLPSGGSTVNIPVSLTVTAPPSVSASPATLTFSYRAGGSAPAAQTLTVAGGGASLAFSATASSTGNWLVVSPATGTTPGTVNVSVNPTSLAANTYTGTVLVAGTGTATGSTTVNVTLTVTAPLPTVTRVTNAASYATGVIAPGEIITLFASDSSIGPATAAGLTLDSSGKVATTIGGVQVQINGYFCPMIYASAGQVSAVVPYELKLFTNATVQIKYLGQSSNGIPVTVSTTLPGVFTANSSGTGPGAILNSNNSINSPANPATRGDTVVVYVTGEGETSPFGVTGKVTTVAAPPQPLTPGPLLQPSVTVGGQPANWSFAGEAPGFVSGVLQLNVTVPTTITAGDQAIVVNIGGNPSQAGVTVSVK